MRRFNEARRNPLPRALTALSAVAVLTSSAAACSSSGSEGSDTTGSAPVTLTVQQQTGQETLFGYFAKAFHKAHPNVTVKLQTISQEQKAGSNLTVLGSANAPDVGFVPVGSSPYTALTSRGGLTDLSDVWSSGDLAKRYGSGVSGSLKVGGKPYVVAFSQAIYNVVWYNPAAFAKAGVTVPTDHRFATPEDLIAAAKKLKSAGYAPLQLGGASGYQASWMVDALLPTSASPAQLENYLASYNSKTAVTAKYTDPAFTKVLSTLENYRKSGVYQDGFLGQKYQDAETPFLAGKAGMFLGGNFTAADFVPAKTSVKPDWLLLPPVNAGTKTTQTGYYGDALGIPVRAQHKAWAKKFLEFVMSEKAQSEGVVGTANLLPGVKDLPASAFTKLDANSRSILADIAKNGSAAGWTSVVPNALAQTFIDPKIQAMYSGSLSPSALAQQQQDELLSFRKSAS
ncbi:ABC transporter substrate-binding protein [Streptomyces europaeiscabiei]|uniref:ABC transporter substrate-binding protein n=1 Tax=Streptomyces europaeiscabiei TaxID=146819 RepID=UPI002E27DCDA|nr:extracellular solute-binding protein [Streptomyces europaeiscabiei]